MGDDQGSPSPRRSDRCLSQGGLPHPVVQALRARLGAVNPRYPLPPAVPPDPDRSPPYRIAPPVAQPAPVPHEQQGRDGPGARGGCPGLRLG